jgi:hypothetical protein
VVNGAEESFNTFLETRRLQHSAQFFSLSDVTPEISHWRADVRIGGKLKIETD